MWMAKKYFANIEEHLVKQIGTAQVYWKKWRKAMLIVVTISTRTGLWVRKNRNSEVMDVRQDWRKGTSATTLK